VKPQGPALLLAAAGLLTDTRPAHAQAAAPTCGACARCEDRVRSIAAALAQDEHRTLVWYWSWMAAGTALLVGQATLASLTGGNNRVEFVAGAATSVFIPSFLLLHPPLVLGDAPALRARLEATTTDGRLGDACIAFDRARELLARDAADEAFATGWLAHTFVIAGNIGVGLVLGIAFHDWWGAAKQAVGGSAVGELQILTLPAGALGATPLGLAGTF
jgi:hypothetical protein